MCLPIACAACRNSGRASPCGTTVARWATPRHHASRNVLEAVESSSPSNRALAHAAADRAALCARSESFGDEASKAHAVSVALAASSTRLHAVFSALSKENKGDASASNSSTGATIAEACSSIQSTCASALAACSADKEASICEPSKPMACSSKRIDADASRCAAVSSATAAASSETAARRGGEGGAGAGVAGDAGAGECAAGASTGTGVGRITRKEGVGDGCTVAMAWADASEVESFSDGRSPACMRRQASLSDAWKESAASTVAKRKP
mmetsp:Transcript_32477/g.112350  ORF Transcript_32477/g.112350 Transcript_32477/m.112350 type:complete len:270 (+) Transcript_32477:715-1524(+)